jgi:hypothetical protein
MRHDMRVHALFTGKFVYHRDAPLFNEAQITLNTQ